MGSVHCSIPTKLALELQAAFNLRAFVETGLGQGTSTLWACEHFYTVVSIESDMALIHQFQTAYPNSKARLVYGDSALEIRIAHSLTIPALFWLDGHTDDYNPILAELAAINFSSLPHVIMIDDWRLFGTLRDWPSKEKVVMWAGNIGARLTYDIDDVLIAYPKG